MPFLLWKRERMQRPRLHEHKDEIFGVGGEEVMNEIR